MLSSPYFDTLITMVFVYALLGILVSILLEMWNQFIKQRGVFLQNAIFRLLDDPINTSLGYLIYQHPAINRQRKDGHSYPYYISAETFCNALIDIIADQALKVSFTLNADGKYQKEYAMDTTTSLTARFSKAVNEMKDSEMKMMFRSFIDRSNINGEPDLSKLKTEILQWYNDYMDRVTGQYKTMNRPKLLFLGMLIAVTLNVDSLHLTQTFFRNKVLRDTMLADATGVARIYNESGSVDAPERYDRILAYLSDSTNSNDSLSAIFLNKLWIEIQHNEGVDSLQKKRMNAVFSVFSRWEIPLGYNRMDAPLSWFSKDSETISGMGNNPVQNAAIDYHVERNKLSFPSFLKWLFGIIISGIALGYGAPFWFEILAKFINIRNAGIKPLKSIVTNITSNS